ncbi:MAG: acyltransferase domain-containing protein [Caldicoprobacterales bacterium]|jgi:hypothetical protein
MTNTKKNLSIHDYTCPESIKGLCERLDFPQEAEERILFHAENMDFEPFEPHFPGLFSLETGPKAVEEIPRLCISDDDPTGDTGFKALTVYLAAALHTHEIYREFGIPDDIYYDSMEAFCLFVKEHKVSYGCYGFDRHFWIYRQLSAKIFRLGTLEFEITTLPGNAPQVGPASGGSPVLSVHIPSDAVLTREELDKSYKMAVEFFAKYFPDYSYDCIYCSTWLLSPVLKKILKPGSRILEFQSDYEITHVDYESNSGIRWIYKREYDDYTQLPEDTSLMRGMKRILLEGGKTGNGTGYLKDFSG